MGWSRAAGGIALGAALACVPSTLPAAAEDAPPGRPAMVRAEPVPRTLPAFYEENRGQAPSDLLFLARTQGGFVGLRKDGVRLFAPGSIDRRAGRLLPLEAEFVGGAAVTPVPERPLPARVAYFLGGERTVRAKGLPTFGAVKQPGVWPGIDLVWTLGEDGPRLRVTLSPRAEAGAAVLRFPAASGVSVEPDGSLLVRAGEGGLRLSPPRGGAFDARTGREVGFRAAAATGERAVETDLLPFEGERGVWFETSAGVGAAPDGTLVLAGATTALGIPGFDNASADPRMPRTTDAFVARVDPSGTVLLSCLWFGGSGTSLGASGTGAADLLAVGADGSAALVGHTLAGDLPTTPGAFQPSRPGPMSGFAIKVSPAGDDLLFATYLGGEQADRAFGTTPWAVAVDGSGGVVVAGETQSARFPFTHRPLRPGHGGGTSGGFVARLSPDGKSLSWARGLADLAHSASPWAAEIDRGGGIWLAGNAGGEFRPVDGLPGKETRDDEVFLARLKPDGSEFTFASRIPGSADSFAAALAVDASGEPVLAGGTRSPSLALEKPAMASFDGPDWDLFLTRLRPGGRGFRHSSYLGFGVGNVELYGSLALDPAGRAVVAGSTQNFSEWNDTPMELRHRALPRWFFTVWSAAGDLERTADADLLGHPAHHASLAVAPCGQGGLSGVIEDRPHDPLGPPGQRILSQAFLLLLDVRGDGLFPAPPEGVDPRFTMRPVGPAAAPGSRRTAAPVAAASPGDDGVAARKAGADGNAGEGGPTDGTKEAEASRDPVLLDKGLLLDRPRPGADHIRVEGRFDEDAFEKAGGFDPATDNLQIFLGNRNAPFLFRIEAGDPGWKIQENGRMEWRSPTGGELAGRVVLFPDRGTFFVRLYGFDFPGPQVNPIGVAFEVRRALGATEAKWLTDGKGVFRYP